MNRNVNSHFSRVPQMHHQRSSFDRSYSNSTTFNFGKIVPIMTEEVLPGDTVQVSTSKIARLTTMLAPIYGNMYLDTYYFFCPNRILWKHWKEFMGENTASAWIPAASYTVPKTTAPTGGWSSGTIADYMGIPVNVEGIKINSLPFRAYAMICNEFFRDQNLSDPLVTDDSDSNVTGSNGDSLQDVVLGGVPYTAAKFHDYFTSCLPSPQKGPAVNIAGNATLRAPVMTGPEHGLATRYVYGTSDPDGQYIVPVVWQNVKGGPYTPPLVSNGSLVQTNVTSSTSSVHSSSSSYRPAPVGDPDRSPYAVVNPNVPNALNLIPSNLWAFAGPGYADSTGAINISVNSLRLAIVTQLYYEALARAGSRYEEQLQQFFGVTNPDSRMNHPEYLGGNRIQLNVHEVTNTAQSESDFLGDVGAKSVTSDSHFDFSKSFTEHGWLIGVCVARYEHSYNQGIPRKFHRFDKFDYYNPLFANIGEQPVYKSELYAVEDDTNSKTVFGYQEAWADYRYSPNMVTGMLRPNVDESLGHWTLSDNYASVPSLSDDWIREDLTNVDRVLAVTHAVANQIFADFYFKAIYTRAMPMFSVPSALGTM